MNVGAIILSPGIEPFDPRVREEYRYGEFANVVTSMDYERLLCATGPYQGEVLRADKKPGVVSTHLHADGTYKDLLYFPSGVSKRPDEFHAGRDHIHMSGNEVFKVAVNTLGRIVDETLAANNLRRADIDWLIPHQANMRIIQATARKLKMPMDRVIQTVQDHGNTSAASVPMALDVAIRDGRIQRGDTLLLEAFGGGFTLGSALVKY